MIQPSLHVPHLDSTGGQGGRTAPAAPLRPSGGEASRRRTSGFVFAALCSAATWLSCAVLAVLLGTVVVQAWGWLDLQFLTSFDSRKPERAGLLAGLWGTFWLILLTILFSLPVGIAAAIYLEEYASDTWITRLIRVNIANLAGVPSIVYGLLGLTVFVRMFGAFSDGGAVQQWTGRTIDGVTLWTTAAGEAVRLPLPFGATVMAGALTLALLNLPVIIVASQEALRAIPASLRHASLALGATKWQTIRHQVLPAGLPGMLTGIILAISRAIGETAPLLMIGAATFVTFTPGSVTQIKQLVSDPAGVVRAPFDTFTAIPIQIFNWATQPQAEYQHVAAAGILVLLIVLLILNRTAIYVRHHFQKGQRW
jgi:phosphate transport system permease protein